jgi:alkanesulfonate monooxygenase SsuD/methylene tetrahydromethanopterin reductase-like flavin-dependent oxidoreductase (luciferase family)
MAFFGIRFDLRNPAFAGTSMADRYKAALDMAEWADGLGLAMVTLSEHHGSPDGYLPSPLPMAAAIAARTKNIAIYVAAIVAAFHDPLRLAEDAAVVDLVSQGRLHLVVANGYVVEEFAMFDVPMGERAARTTEVIRVLQQAWAGAPFEHRGRTVQVAPTPFREGGPALMLGGSSDAAARRAARLGVGYQPSNSDSWDAFRAECAAQGRPDPGGYLGGDSTVVILASDPDATWDAVAPYALHEANAYGSWAAAASLETGYHGASDADELRASGQYRVVTPAQLVADLEAQGPFAFALLHPMLGGIPPELAWESLHLLEHEVLPRLGSDTVRP